MTEITRQFFQALSVCVGDESIKFRLACAWETYLDKIDCEDLPQPVPAEINQLREAMYKEKPGGGEHPARASVRKMSARDAAECTRTIASIYGVLSTPSHKRASGTSGNIVVHIEECVSPETNPALN